jgi:hypothetical protein
MRPLVLLYYVRIARPASRYVGKAPTPQYEHSTSTLRGKSAVSADSYIAALQPLPDPRLDLVHEHAMFGIRSQVVTLQEKHKLRLARGSQPADTRSIHAG